MQYELIRSGRKTLSLEIRPDGSLLARAPYRMPKSQIDEFILKKGEWIRTHQDKVRNRRRQAEETGGISYEEIRRLADRAVEILPVKVAHYAAVLGVTYHKITIRNQKTRWGSCTQDGNLNFNCLLMLVPEEIQDYVVVHELCHRKEMNHSPRFWAEVARVIPDYSARRKWLKEHGGVLIAAMDAGE
ncbi:MAG: M48 family metallopeptidase [Parasporobacterium sp.]|nr:M48 family metallopeptidase [Parasporobacterium sp.]